MKQMTIPDGAEVKPLATVDSTERAALEALVVNFTEAFNRENIDEVMSYFAEDAIYDEFHGTRHTGAGAIREAFIPQFRGDYGKMRFHTEDMFIDVAAGKAMIRWLLTLETDERAGGWQGLDLLHFKNDKLLEKHTYAKAKVPLIEIKEDSVKVREALENT